MEPRVGYFSAEVAYHKNRPLFSGGLGVLAGDILKSAADMGKPMYGVSLMYPQGYFTQEIQQGNQVAHPQKFRPSLHMERLEAEPVIELAGEDVRLRAWTDTIRGRKGNVPLYLLDSRHPQNMPNNRNITDSLYSGEREHRLRQEAVLGMGGVKLLQMVGKDVDFYHLNEGHAALVALELQRQGHDNDAIRHMLRFTTHTPVPAGHDRFEFGLLDYILRHGNDGTHWLKENGRDPVQYDTFNNTILALNLSAYKHAVSELHARVSRDLFPGHNIEGITNGVHLPTWVGPAFEEVYDQYLPEWRDNPAVLENAASIPADAILRAHLSQKRKLLEVIEDYTGRHFDINVPTIGFARRFAPYKRGDLLVRALDQLQSMGDDKVQVVFAGKAHPQDEPGKDLLRRVYSAQRDGNISIVFLENYDMRLGRILTGGSDIWGNAPVPGNEASGTSGMKAAANAVPQLTTYDGWAPEARGGNIFFGDRTPRLDINSVNNEADAHDLAQKLHNEVLPLLRDPQASLPLRIEAIQNAAYFNTNRVVDDLFTKMYR